MEFLIIMPCYNAESTIARAIESVINQSYFNWELVIVDDASTDNSVSIINKYLKHPKVTLLQNKTNKGCYYSRNRALHYFKDKKWDWFTVHDADDTSTPNRLRIYAEYINKSKLDYIYSANRGNRYNFLTQELSYVNHSKFVGQAFISKYLFNILGYFDNTRFGGDSEYEHRYLILVQTLALKILGKPLPRDEMYEYCFKNNIMIGKLKNKYAYTYTFGYTPFKNLTQTISLKERQDYKEFYTKKWSKVKHSKEMYIDFTPHKKDL